MTKTWVPDAGEIIWIGFDPQAAGHRPALVLSPAAYNGPTGLLLCVPMTTRAKRYRFEVPLGGSTSVALADQVKSFDWRARGARRKGRATADELEAVRARARVLVG